MSRRWLASRHSGLPRAGFTLVEMLAVMVIIAILAAALLTALASAQEIAKRNKTHQVINKLHNQLMQTYETYQMRRLPIDVTQSLGTNESNQTMHRRQLWAKRELMRMEMPDRYNDLLFTPKFLTTSSGKSSVPFQADLRRSYLRRVQMTNPGLDVPVIIDNLRREHQASECLYMLMSFGATDRDMSATVVSDNDIGDKDNDGMFEFLDGWGQPIAFLRWAPGFPTQLQPELRIFPGEPTYNLYPGNHPKDPENPTAILTRDPVGRHDAFDPFHVDKWEPGSSNNISQFERGYHLVPLIFSAGPSGSFGLDFNFTADPNQEGTNNGVGAGIDTDPYALYTSESGSNQLRGRIIDSSAYDNIHNHLLGLRR